MPSRSRFFTGLTLAALIAVAILFFSGHREPARPLVVGFFVLLALALRGHPPLKAFAFTASVLFSVSLSVLYPRVFGTWYGFRLDLLIVPLTQIIMFAMGTTLTLGDFARVLAFPWPVMIGLVLHFTVMPMVAVVITRTFGFHGELAAGVILIGSVSAGMASNLMCYLARGNVALSVTMTLFSTLAAPFLTPLLMSWLAGQYIAIDTFKMMLSIVNMILVPIAAGLVANAILFNDKRWAKNAAVLVGIAAGCVALAAIAIHTPTAKFGTLAPLKTGAVVGCCMIGVVAIAKLIVSVMVGYTGNWMDAALPLV